MKRIFKYRIGLGAKIEVGTTFEPLDAQIRDGAIHLWALTDEKPVRAVFVYALGTGATPLDENTYISTVQDGHHVWHLFWYESDTS